MTAAPLLVLVGPTAAGKSAVALAVAEAVGGEIVSADSVQVYRGVDLGSAKPTAAEQARVRHHCIDLADPTEQLDAATWAAAADAAIADARARGRVPIVCGGTGLYVRALLHGLTDLPDPPPDVRDAVRADLAARGPAALHAELAAVDPQAAARVPPTDPQRITRALEVYRATGRPLSAWQADHGFRPRRYDAHVVGLWPDRDVLRARIYARARAMLASGWPDEVRALLARGVPPDAPPLRALGYREVVAHVLGHLPAADLPDAVARGHWQYARRQLTWFRGITTREDALVHHEPGAPDLVARLSRTASEPAP